MRAILDRSISKLKEQIKATWEIFIVIYSQFQNFSTSVDAGFYYIKEKLEYERDNAHINFYFMAVIQTT